MQIEKDARSESSDEILSGSEEEEEADTDEEGKGGRSTKKDR